MAFHPNSDIARLAVSGDYQVALVLEVVSVNLARRCRLAATSLALLVLATAHGQESDSRSDTETTQASAAGRYQVSFDSELEPIGINQIHSWVLHVETKYGQLVSDAEITVAGGMPEHDHGLPTTPQMTQYLGKGDYLIEGMKFHMNGLWQVTFTISEGGESDRVTFDLEL